MENKKVKELIIIRGLPGAGKSTLAKSLGGINIEADQYFMVDGEYKFDSSKIKLAHNYCQSQTQAWMGSNGEQLDLTEYQVWSVYFSKHIFSIQNAIKNFPDNPDNNLAEPLDSRITDAGAYLFLLYGMSKRNKPLS